MKSFVIGAKGYLGKALVKAGFLALEADICDYDDVEKAIQTKKPELVLHLAGKSKPDWIETHLDEAILTNIRGTYSVAEVCVKNKIPVVYLSSSQIWGGGWWESLHNDHSENSKYTASVNSYGMQKVAAESIVHWLCNGDFQVAKIIRSSFVFNAERMCEELNCLKYGRTVDAPTFIKRSFIHLDDFVNLISEYCKRFDEMPHILHLAGSKTVSYYDFWMEVCKQYGYDRKLVKRRTQEKEIFYTEIVNGSKQVFPAARRPHNAGLNTSLSQELGFPQFDYIGGIARMKNES